MNKKVNSKEFHVMNCLGCNHIGFNVWEFFIKWPKEMGGGRSLCFETAQDAKDFLKSESGVEFNFESENIILSHQSGFDGFYMALLSRNK